MKQYHDLLKHILENGTKKEMEGNDWQAGQQRTFGQDIERSCKGRSEARHRGLVFGDPLSAGSSQVRRDAQSSTQDANQ